MMTDLSPKARALMQSGRGALRATNADRERIEALLRTRLGSDALPHEPGVAQASSRLSWQAVAGVAGGICVLGAVAFVALRPAAHAPAAPARSPVVAAPQSAPLEPPPTAAGVPAPVAPAPDAVSAAETPDSQPPRVRDRLAREVALLSRATSELRAGHAAAALKILAEHRRSFPNGTLREERRAAEAQALCSLGRVREGRAELAQLAPGSPAAARAEQACAPASSAAGDRP
jgi:hypothetical protein